MGTDMDEVILDMLRDMGPSSGAELSRVLGISRQSVNYHLKGLVEIGRIARTGRTRGTRYMIAGNDGKPVERSCRCGFIAGRHDEEQVFLNVSSRLSLDSSLNVNVVDVYRYALTEMINNAIEHSMVGRGEINASVTSYRCHFSVMDRGIGAFESIRRSEELPDVESAALEVLKGKRTSAPEGHSGEGLFFTRKCADDFSLSANGLLLRFDENGSHIESVRRKKGTVVEFAISRSSRRTLPTVFAAYAPESRDYAFVRTVVHLSLYSSSLQSRSIARRVTAGLGDFSEVILDFRGVRSLGQGFADEVFRIYAGSHPEVDLSIENLLPALRPMIEHVRSFRDPD